MIQYEKSVLPVQNKSTATLKQAIHWTIHANRQQFILLSLLNKLPIRNMSNSTVFQKKKQIIQFIYGEIFHLSYKISFDKIEFINRIIIYKEAHSLYKTNNFTSSTLCKNK